MINVKLIVLLILTGVRVIISENCDICPNHTLCKYTAGPSRECVGYDSSALLTRREQDEIVARINEHRAHVAQGLTGRLPPAANMRKMSWSAELARAAQRWADQCDPHTRPDRHDQCRNLANTAVGQNIATISGPAPGLNVKSFVDTWYMHISAFTGSVTLYNQSTDRRKNYFTQLIWAETDTLGCGKARFYIESGNTVVERLVCNFAPRGNILGKPMYMVGFPGTQCPRGTTPDTQHPALCARNALPNGRDVSVKTLPVTSLLQILNLSNDSIKQDIDPNEYKQIDVNEIYGDHRNQRIRHVFNNSFAADMYPFLPRPPHWNISNNSRRFPLYQHHYDKGHSRVYHGPDYTESMPSPPTGASDFRRYEYPTPSPDYNAKNFRRFNQDKQCTRHKSPPGGCNGGCAGGCSSIAPCVINKCTRGQRSDCFTPPCATQHDGCVCSKQAACGHSNSCSGCCSTCQTSCNTFQTNPLCCQTKCPNNNCPHAGRRIGVSVENTRPKPPEPIYYDQFPHLGIRSGDSTTKHSPNEHILHKKKSIVETSTSHDGERKSTNMNVWDQYDTNGQVNNEHRSMNNPTILEEKHEFSYDSFDSNKRYKRESEDISHSLLWKLGEYNTVNPKQLKALRYTTLLRAETGTFSSEAVTEPITFNLRSLAHHEEYSEHSTEKYVLSFEELMRFRNTGKANARRKEGRATTTKASSTNSVSDRGATDNWRDMPRKTTAQDKTKQRVTKIYDFKRPGARRYGARRDDEPPKTNQTNSNESSPVTDRPKPYTISSTFSPVSYCTRKITCTYTPMPITAIDANGSTVIINGGGNGGGGGGGGGPNTPPGYVKGCTRTSTCTRKYHNLNKLSTVRTTNINDMVTPEDEDYCEKRALNLKRRNSEDDDKPIKCATKSSFNIFDAPYEDDDFQNDGQYTKSIEVINATDMNMKRERNGPSNNDKLMDIRTKRQKRCGNAPNQVTNKCNKCNQNTKIDYRNPVMSYGDLYYLVLSKLVKSGELKKITHESGKCSCNGNVKQNRNTDNVYLFLIVFNIFKSHFVLN